MRVSYFCNVTRSGVSAVVKEAMFMRSSGHLLRRAGREFVRNLIWMAVVFGSPAAILAASTDLSVVGVSAFVGVCVAVMAAIVTVGALWSGAHDETRLGGHDYPGSHPGHGGDWPVRGWDGGGEEKAAGEAYIAAFAPVRNDP
jgi:hypothetical protein